MSNEHAQSSPLGRLAARGTVWTILGFGGTQVIRLGANLVLTRLLFEEAFGLMALVWVFLVAINLFSDLGIGPSIIQNERGEDPDFFNTAWTLQIGRGALIWIATAIGSIPFAYFYEEPELRLLLPVCGLTAVLAGFNSTKLYDIQRKLDLKRRVLIDVAGAVIGSAVMIVLAYQWRSVWALAVGSIISSAVTLLLSHVAIPGPGNRLKFERKAFGTLVRFGRWIFVSTMLTFFVSHSDRLIFGKLLPMSMLGVYSIGANLAALPPMGVSRISHQILFPVWSRLRNERKDINPSIRSMRGLALLAAGWICAGFISGGAVIIAILYDDRYTEAGWVLQLLSLGAWFVALESTSVGVFLARGESQWLSVFGAVKLVGLAIFIPAGYYFFDFPGAVGGYVASDLLRYLVVAFALARAGTKTFFNDVLLTLMVLGSAALAYIVAQRVDVGSAPLVVDAALIFVIVTALWAPLLAVTWRRRKRVRAREEAAADAPIATEA